MKKQGFALPLIVLLAATACGGSDDSSSSSSAGSSSAAAGGGEAGSTSTESATAALKLVNPGQLTVGAEFPAQGFLNLPRENPTGFEADVAREIGKRLGLSKVVWLETPFTSIFSPAPKKFDFDINEITITPERQKVVDFSAPYFDANQGLLVHKGTKAESARSLADMKDLQFGGQVTTTGLDYIKKKIRPTKPAREYNTTTAASQALVVKQIDVFVIDVPIAAALQKQFSEDLVQIGQIITNEKYGTLFEKGNPLKANVDQAIEAMRSDGTLKRLQDKWFPGTTSLPTFK